MKHIKSTALFAVSVVGLAVIGVSASAMNHGDIRSGFDFVVDEAGVIKLPEEDFRAKWTMLGAWTVNGEDGAEGTHTVYAQPGVAEAYRETGAFPDGAVLVKELRSATTEDLTTGNVSYAADLQGWFVMVKDTEGRFPDNGLWGDGWGWAYFGADDPKALVTKDYALECKGCHIPARDTDWIYTRAYPALKG